MLDWKLLKIIFKRILYFGLQMLRNWPNNMCRQKMNLNHPSLAAPDLEMTRVTEVIS